MSNCNSSKVPSNDVCFLTERELAARQRRSVKTLQAERVAGGGIPFVKFGRSVRYRLSDVETWEQAHVMRSTSDIAKSAGEKS